jgi:hypothetical protein
VSAERYGGLRAVIAAEAARLMYEEGEEDDPDQRYDPLPGFEEVGLA